VLQPGAPKPGRQPDRPRVGRLIAAQNPKERGLAGAVPADDAHAFARLELERNIVQKGQMSEGQ